MNSGRVSVLPALGWFLAVLLLWAPSSLHAQGVGISAIPTVERAWWGSDILIPNATYLGGGLSLHFGRFVALDGHYVRSERLDHPSGPPRVGSNRRGGEVLFVLTPSRFTPFLRLGASVLEFERTDGDAESVRSQHLAASLGTGIRFDVYNRLRGELVARHVGFRASPGSGLIEDPGEEGGSRNVRKLVLALGVHVPLGGEWDDPETDHAVRSLQLVSVPAHTFVGSLRFHDALGLPDHRVAGVAVGAEFGPYVGVRGYGFGSLEDGFSSLTRLLGYGLEGSFNLISRDAPATPQLILGAGQLKFPEEERALAGLDSRRIWTATVGGGLDMKLTERFRGEISARNLLLSRSAPGEVEAPDQIRSNWLLSGGVRFQLRGDAPGSPPRDPAPPVPARGIPRVTPPPAADAETTAALEELDLQAERLIRELQVERLRQALETLREAGDPSEADRLLARHRGDPESTLFRTFELPVLDAGEIHIRFGEGEAFRRVLPGPEEARPQEAPPAVAGRDPRVDELLQAISRLQSQVETLLERPAPPARPDVPVRVELAPGERAAEVVEEAPPRGIFRGEPIRPRGLGIHGGGSFGDRSQALFGLQGDLGSALGGNIRVRPDLILGITKDFTWNTNLHVEWPLPFQIRGVQPFVGGGAGLLRGDGITRVLVPNVVVGAMHPLSGSLEAFVTFQSLDLLSENRVLAGLRLRPRERAPTVAVRPVREGAPAARPVDPVDEEPDPELLRELDALRQQVAELRAGIERMEQARLEVRPAEPAPEEEPPPAEEPTPPARELLEALRELTTLRSVLDVRPTERGIAIVLGGGDTFLTGAATLSPNAHAEVEALARALIDTPYHLSVEGHTDSRGGEGLNQQLSEGRAEAVRSALLAFGIRPARVTSTGFGPTRPIAGNHTAEGRAQNRRVEIVLIRSDP
jgi:outer membrane protein OmpA-like peptidoglycan-associated protein